MMVQTENMSLILPSATLKIWMEMSFPILRLAACSYIY